MKGSGRFVLGTDGTAYDASTGEPITRSDPRWPQVQAAITAQAGTLARWQPGGDYAADEQARADASPGLWSSAPTWWKYATLGSLTAGLAGPALAGAGAGDASGGGVVAGLPGEMATLPAAGAAAGGMAAAAAPAVSMAAPIAAHAAASSLVPGVSNAALFQTGAQLFGNLFGAWMAGNGADAAAQQAAQAAEYAARLQYDANQKALQFNREQAENAYLNSEAARRGNYDIWAAGQRRLGFLGSEVGLGPREIPDYVPGVDPRFTDGGGGVMRPMEAGGGAPSALAEAPKSTAVSAVQDAVAKGLTGQAAIDYINSKAPGSAVVVQAGTPVGQQPAGKIVWYDKGNGAGKFQMTGPESWEIKTDPALGQGWIFNPLTGQSTPASSGSAAGMFAPYTSGPPVPFYQKTTPTPIPGFLGGY